MVLSLWLIWAGLIHVAKVCHKWLKAFLKGHSYVSQLPFHVKFLSDIYISKEASFIVISARKSKIIIQKLCRKVSSVEQTQLIVNT